MEDVVLMVVFGFIAVVSGLVGGFVAQTVVSNARYAFIENKLSGIDAKINSQSGVEARAIKSERMNQAMAELAMALKDPNVDKGKVLQELIAKYPDVALTLGKKLGIGI